MKSPVITCTKPHIERLLRSWGVQQSLPQPGQPVTLMIPPSEKINFANAELVFDRTRDDGMPDYKLTFTNPVDTHE